MNAQEIGATGRILDLVDWLSWDRLPAPVRLAARRHLLDTVGAMIAGMSGPVARSVAVLVGEPAGLLAVPGAPVRVSRDGFAFLCGTAAHGIELDDGHRGGTVHPGVAVVPALLAALSATRSAGTPATGRDLLTALVVGYEVVAAVAAAANPAFRNNGFHPTSVAGPLGAAMAVGHLLGLKRSAVSCALGIAASSAGGLFAFLKGGGDVKRLHGGMAARGGLMAALLADQGVSAPERIIEGSSGFAQAFAGAPPGEGLGLSLPPADGFNILDCYFKPHACCRHLQPAMEAVMRARAEHGVEEAMVEAIDVETYAIAARHAATGWETMVDAQLSFPYGLALALRFGRADLGLYDDAVRCGDWVTAIAERVHVQATAEMDALYPANRPARVTLRLKDGCSVTVEAMEASGCRDLPLSDAALRDKFLALVEPVMGPARAGALLATLWAVEDAATAETLFSAF